ncbi:MAG: hypothetical protein ABJB12_22045 [Pseudomonadota bacterium]
MNNKRSMWKLLFAGVSVGLLVTNCTVKTGSDTVEQAGATSAGASNDGCTAGHKKTGCECSDKSTAYQVCGKDGLYGSCVCPSGTTAVGGANNSSAGANNSSAGANNSNGGATSYSGGTATEAGAAPFAEAGSGGEGGALVIDPTDCGSCLAQLCAKQFAACDDDPNCISTNVDGTGQYERIVACIDKERVKGLVKRDVVRGCGVTIGLSADSNVISSWAPEDMDPVTTDLLNCMADAPGAAPASWANDDANYVDNNDMVRLAPWPAGTCAKLACTSAITPN